MDDKRELLLTVNSTSDTSTSATSGRRSRRARKQRDALDIEQASQKSFLGIKGQLGQNVKVVVLVGAWWTLSIAFNVYNKYFLNACDLPWVGSLVCLLVGVPLNLIYWATGFRKAPKLSKTDILALVPITIWHLGSHVSSILSLGAGAVSFAQIVKTFEPVAAAFCAGLMLNRFFSWPVYASLVPIIGGVAYSCVKGEIGFTMMAFVCAMAANLFAGLRGAHSKLLMQGRSFTANQNMDAPNFFGVLIIMSTIVCIPLTIALEGHRIAEEWEKHKGQESDLEVIMYLVLAGVFNYTYGEVAFVVLDNVHPVTHAVCNTLKRVAVIGAAIFVFHTPMSTNGYIGATIAVLGTLIYSRATKTFTTTYSISCREATG